MFLLQVVHILLNLQKGTTLNGRLLSSNCIYQTPSKQDSPLVSSVSNIIDGVPQPGYKSVAKMRKYFPSQHRWDVFLLGCLKIHISFKKESIYPLTSHNCFFKVWIHS